MLINSTAVKHVSSIFSQLTGHHVQYVETRRHVADNSLTILQPVASSITADKRHVRAVSHENVSQ